MRVGRAILANGIVPLVGWPILTPVRRCLECTRVYFSRAACFVSRDVGASEYTNLAVIGHDEPSPPVFRVAGQCILPFPESCRVNKAAGWVDIARCGCIRL